MTSTGFRWEDRFEQFDGLGETQLFHLARNEAVPVENRTFVVELMLRKGYQSVKHIDLRDLVARLDYPVPPENTHLEADFGAPSASVTTKTMSEDHVFVQKMDRIPPANEALTSETTPETEKELTNEQ